MSGSNRLRFTLADQDGARQMVRASLPDVHGEALLLCGGERAQAFRLTEQTFAWLGREVRHGRETVTLGRLLLVLRHHFLEELHPVGRRRRRARAAAQALDATRAVIDRRRGAAAPVLLGELPQLARAVVVLRHVDLMLLPDVAAALRLAEETVAEIDVLVMDALAPVGGVAALRAAVSAGPPPLALTGRVLAPLIEAVTPTYVFAPVTARPTPFGVVDGGSAPVERTPRRLRGVVVALVIVASLVAVSAGRRLIADDPVPAPPPVVTAPCTIAVAPASPAGEGGLAPLSPLPRAACPAP